MPRTRPPREEPDFDHLGDPQEDSNDAEPVEAFKDDDSVHQITPSDLAPVETSVSKHPTTPPKLHSAPAAEVKKEIHLNQTYLRELCHSLLAKAMSTGLMPEEANDMYDRKKKAAKKAQEAGVTQADLDAAKASMPDILAQYQKMAVDALGTVKQQTDSHRSIAKIIASDVRSFAIILRAYSTKLKQNEGKK